MACAISVRPATMRIAVDIRSLAEPRPGGVTVYARQLLARLIPQDRDSSYVLFGNSWKKQELDLRGQNVIRAQGRWPNKLMNASLASLAWPSVERWTGKIDVLFMPNLNFVQFSKKTPLVLTIHDLSFELFPELLSRKRRLWHQLVGPRKLVQRASRIIAVSESTRRDIIELFNYPKDRVHTVYSGADHLADDKGVSEAFLRKEFSLERPYVLSLSFLEPRKNIITVLEAFDMAVTRYALPHDLVLAGSPSWDHPRLESVLRRLRHSDRIRCIGYVSEQKKASLLKAASAFIYPSLYEGFGFPPLESLRVGTPVIASIAPSLPEVLRNSSLLVAPDTVSDLTEAIRSILLDADVRRAALLEAQDTLDRYRWDDTARRTKEIIHEAALEHAYRN
ncbi:MAG: glycosyltransferase family 1 protein [bacterium]|nr:glycosyltransferase family 1 protein [bacterium]